MPLDAWLLALAAAFFFGLALVLTQFGLNHLPSFRGAIVSLPTSAVWFWVVGLFMLDGDGWRIDAAAIFAAVGLLFPVAVTLLTFEGNRRMGPNITGAVGGLAPLFAVMFAVIVLNEAPTLVQLLGIGAIVAGVAVMSASRRQATATWPYWVLALPLLAAAIRGGTQPVVKAGLALWSSPLAAVVIGTTVSSIVILLVAVIRARGWPRGFNRNGVLWFFSVGTCNGAAVIALYAALAKGPVTLVSPLAASYPLVTLGLSAVLLRSVRPSPRLALGVAATVGGVVLLLIA